MNRLAPSVAVMALLAWLAAGTTAFGEAKVLENFTLIDGTGTPPLAGAALVVADGKIEYAGPAAQMKVPIGAQRFNLAGKYVMPGLINLHAHVGNVRDLAQDPRYFTRENVQSQLATYASYGVTSVVSLGTDPDLVYQIRAEQRAGRPSVTRLFTAGQGFTVKGG